MQRYFLNYVVTKKTHFIMLTFLQLIPKDPFFDFTLEQSCSDEDEQCIFDYPPKLVFKWFSL